MKIGFLSDIHLEFGVFHPDLEKDEGGDVLLLVGDITTAYSMQQRESPMRRRTHEKNMEKLKKLCDGYKHVYYIMGNHEHYNSVFGQTFHMLKSGLDDHDFQNVTMVEDQFFEIDGVRFFGATLWTDFFKEDLNAMWAVQMGMNDYRIVYEEIYKPIKPKFTLDIHKNTLRVLREGLDKDVGKKTIVFTHHAPTLKSINYGRYGDVPMNAGYASDLSDLILSYPNIQYWIHGHTHESVEYKVGDYTTVMANQCGYHTEESFKLFKGVRHIEV